MYLLVQKLASHLGLQSPFIAHPVISSRLLCRAAKENLVFPSVRFSVSPLSKNSEKHTKMHVSIKTLRNKIQEHSKAKSEAKILTS